jgi:hypothetical protein
VRSIYTLVTVLGVVVLLGDVGSLLNHETNGARFGLVFGIALIALSEWSRWRDHQR